MSPTEHPLVSPEAMVDILRVVTAELDDLGVVLDPEQMTRLVSRVLFRVEEELESFQSRRNRRRCRPSRN